MYQRIRNNVVFFVVLTSLVCTGCSSGVRVTGKVTFEEDGSPLTVGTVNFETDKVSMIGHLNADGTYVLSPDGRTQRIPKGIYRVYISNAMAPTGELLKLRGGSGGHGDLGGRQAYESVIAIKFTSSMTSGLTCEVNGPTVFDITVTKPN